MLQNNGSGVGRTLHRAVTLTPQDLDDLAAAKKLTAARGIRSAYKEYSNVADTDPAKELELLEALKGEVLAWIDKNHKKAQESKPGLTKDAFSKALGPEDAKSWKVVADLQRAVTSEIQSVKLREQLGLSPALVQQMSPAEAQELLKAGPALQAGKLQAADTHLQSLRQGKLGTSVDLIRSALLRRNIGMVNKAMEAVFDDPKYQLTDPGETGLGAKEAQRLANTFANQVKALKAKQPKQPPKDPKGAADWQKTDAAIMEAEKTWNVLSDLVQSARDKKTQHGELDKLGEEEVAAIIGYSTRLYREINPMLRKRLDKLTKDEEALTKLAVSGLNKLDPHKGTVYRHVEKYSGYEEMNQQGATVVDTTFLSAALSQRGCDTAAEKHEVCEVITSKTGRDISNMSAFPEGEVLFRPGTSFRVTRVDRPDVLGSWPIGTLGHVLASGKKDEFQLVVFKEEA